VLRVDLVWDWYIPNSESQCNARAKRAKKSVPSCGGNNGNTRKLVVDENKVELFEFLSQALLQWLMKKTTAGHH